MVPSPESLEDLGSDWQSPSAQRNDGRQDQRPEPAGRAAFSHLPCGSGSIRPCEAPRPPADMRRGCSVPRRRARGFARCSGPSRRDNPSFNWSCAAWPKAWAAGSKRFRTATGGADFRITCMRSILMDCQIRRRRLRSARPSGMESTGMTVRNRPAVSPRIPIIAVTAHAMEGDRNMHRGRDGRLFEQAVQEKPARTSLRNGCHGRHRR